MKIEECGKDQKTLFRLTKNLIGTDTNVKLPSYTSAEQLVGKFSTFFMRKITAIRDVLLCSSMDDLSSIAMEADNRFSGEKLQVFHPASDREIKGLILIPLDKSCD